MNKEIVQMYAEGMSTTAIGRTIGKDRKSVWLALRAAGVKLRNPGRIAKLPPIEELAILYFGERLTSVQIANRFDCASSNVIHKLRAAGYQTRPRGKGSKRDNSRCCDIDEKTGELCGQPVQKIRHAGNGALYGTRCALHRKLHYNVLNRNLGRKYHNRPPENWTYLNKFRWRDLHARRRAALLAETKQPIIEAKELTLELVQNQRCTTRACPFPVLKDGYCRRCLLDQQMQASPTGTSIIAQDYIYAVRWG